MSGTATWNRAALALRLLAADPSGLGGLWLRARPGPARDAVVAALDRLPVPPRRIHPAIASDALSGGMDLAATLSAGTPVLRDGLLTPGATILLTSAERCGSELAARLGQWLDRGAGSLILLDEAADGDECPPPALTDRIGLFLSLDDVALRDTGPLDMHLPASLPTVTLASEQRDALAVTAASLGIASLRPPGFAAAAARTAATLDGRSQVQDADLRLACELTFAHRAQATPAPEDDTSAPPEESHEQDGETQRPENPDDMLLDAVRAALPPDLLSRLAEARTRRAGTAGGSGAAHRGNRRGRPLPPRPGTLDGRARIDLVATLRAAAPWQPMRRAADRTDRRLHIRSADIRVKQYEETSDRVLIFCVDASGSAAMARLAEAKGAVEILLSEAYARRDHVALIGFRGNRADVLLPPTRSLVQAKRHLAGLPGGGGTPLAAGLQAGCELARTSRGRGLTPSLALLTDGRANIALDGSANRGTAEADAGRMARLLRTEGIAGLVIDTGRRPARSLEELARAFDAPYLALPRADARGLSGAVSAVLG